MVSIEPPPSRILVFKNIMTKSEIENDEDYDDVISNLEAECENYGKIMSLKAPRPEEGTIIPGFGSVFIEFRTADEASRTKKAMDGRNYAENIIKCDYHSEEKFNNDDFTDS